MGGTVAVGSLADWAAVPDVELIGRRHLEQVLRVYVKHYNAHRPHRALELEAPCPAVGLHLIREVAKPGYNDATCLAGSSTQYRRAA
jgi:hypothetical protein